MQEGAQTAQTKLNSEQYKAIARFLNYIFSDYIRQGLGDRYVPVMFKYYGDNEKIIEEIKHAYGSRDGRTFHKFITAKALVTNAEQIAEDLYEMSKIEFDIYVTPLLAMEKSRKSKSMLKLTQFIVLDIDNKKAHVKEQDKATLRRIVHDTSILEENKKHAKALTLALSSINIPGIVVFTGGGAQIWIKLSKLEDFEKVKQFAKEYLVKLFDAIASEVSEDLEVDVSVFDVSRVFRVPYTLNNKYITASGERLQIQAEIVHFDDRTIDFDELQGIVLEELERRMQLGKSHDEFREAKDVERANDIDNVKTIRIAELSENRIIAISGNKKFVYNLEPIRVIKFKQHILKILEDKYIPGRRHWMCHVIAGILYKRGLPQKLARETIEAIVTHFDDEEAEDRLIAVQDTYSKDPANVGTFYILTEMIGVSKEEARAFIRDVLTTIERYLAEKVEILEEDAEKLDEIKLSVGDKVVVVRVGKKAFVFSEDEFVRKKRVNNKIKLSISSKALAEIAIAKFGLSEEIEVTDLEKELLAKFLEAKTNENSSEEDYIELFNTYLLEIVRKADNVETTFKEDEINALVRSNVVVRLADKTGNLKAIALPSALVVKFALDMHLKNFVKEFNKLARFMNLLADEEIVQKKKKKGSIRYYYIRCDNEFIDKETLKEILNIIANGTEILNLISNHSRGSTQEEPLTGGDEL